MSFIAINDRIINVDQIDFVNTFSSESAKYVMLNILRFDCMNDAEVKNLAETIRKEIAKTPGHKIGVVHQFGACLIPISKIKSVEVSGCKLEIITTNSGQPYLPFATETEAQEWYRVFKFATGE